MGTPASADAAAAPAELRPMLVEPSDNKTIAAGGSAEARDGAAPRSSY